MSALVDLTGMAFGSLRILGRAPRLGVSSSARWECVCRCGAVTSVRSNDLRLGKITRCRKCVDWGRSRRAHGRWGTSEYTIWKGIKQRCGNPKCTAWKYYGARGITMCERWNNSFEAFLADMGPRPSADLSIDRINNDGNYEPGNCRWATSSEQNMNKRKPVRKPAPPAVKEPR